MVQDTNTEGTQTTFQALLGNEDGERSGGFVSFVRDADNLLGIEEHCHQSQNRRCLTARYSGTGFALIPLVERFLRDLRTLDLGPDVRLPDEPVGGFRPELTDSRWRELASSLAKHPLQSELDDQPIKSGVSTESFGDLESPLDTSLSTSDDTLLILLADLVQGWERSDRLILLCEMDESPEEREHRAVGLSDEMLRLLDQLLPVQIGIVFTRVPLQVGFPQMKGIRVAWVDDIPLGDEESARSQALANDAATGEDQLNITSEVNALADAIAAKDTKPPLAVGVLGGWGAGKSFVLDLLEKRLRRIRCEDLSNPEVLEAFPFAGHIYTIRFDAWTFSKSNLWASLMHEILVQLDRQIALEQLFVEAGIGLRKDGKYWEALHALDPYEIDRLRSIVDQATRLDDLAEVAGPDEQAREALRRLLEDLVNDLGPAVDPGERDVLWKRLRAIHKEEQVRLGVAERTLAEKRQLLGEKKGEIAREAELRLEAELRPGLWDTFLLADGGSLERALARIAKESGGDIPIEEAIESVSLARRLWSACRTNGWKYVAMLGVSVISGGLIHYFLSAIGWSSVGVGALATVVTSWKAANQAIERLVSRAEQAQKAMLESKAKRRAELEESLSLASPAYQTAQEDVSRCEAEVESLRRIVGITAQHSSLVGFLEERLKCAGYESELGFLHQVQLDIESLSRELLLERLREEDAEPGGDTDAQPLFPRGEPRIVLVIDDIDRCPPRRVVLLLEAVQLLVKTKLFVVVLSMDVRYVTRALEKAYSQILIRDGRPSGLDYIEKIIQIPYRVRSIDEEAMPGYLASQIYVRTPEASEQDPEASRGPDEVRGPGGGALGRVGPPASVAAVVRLPTEVQAFEPTEIQLLSDLAHAVDITPRSVKRLANVMKLLKNITYRSGEVQMEEDILSGMIFVLALSAKYPSVMRQVLPKLSVFVRSASKTKLSMTLRNGIDEQLDFLIEHTDLDEDCQAVRTLLRRRGLLPSGLTLAKIGARNLQLARTFSFIGEADPIVLHLEKNTGTTPQTSDAAAQDESNPDSGRLVE